MPKSIFNLEMPTTGLLEPEFVQPYTAWKDKPTSDNTDAMLKTVHPIITAALRSYGGTGSPNMLHRARIMAVDALQKYDPKQAKLKTHLLSQLQGLRRHATREQQIVAVPEKVSLDLGTIYHVENELRDELGREPSVHEVSTRTFLSPKRITYVKKLKPGFSESYLSTAATDGDDVFAPAVRQRNVGAKHWNAYVYHDLDPIDQVIMEYTLGMHGKPILQNQEIAKKLKLTPGAISQRKSKIQAKLALRDEFEVI